ncbi:MAG: SDR family NAD(P)-dependent oxidoreductase [Actinomycetota bacterium]|nr:SDR family NAD(P)-dependent oxidoreductase [Actinomycetota bacterium]
MTSDAGPFTVAVTGAARGIGYETARQLAARGHRVAIGDRDGDLAEAAAARIGELARGYRLDVASREEFGRWLDAVERDLGPLDVLINNAGIAPVASKVAGQDPEAVKATLDVNLGGVINGTLEAILLMEPRGRGQVINISSLAGLIGVPGLAAYAASKHGVIGFTESVRAEYRRSGIQFTCVLPGPTATRMMDGTRSSPVVKLTRPEDLAARIAGTVGRRCDRFAYPRLDGLFARISGNLPPAAGQWLQRLVRADRIYTDIHPVARDGYESWLDREQR